MNTKKLALALGTFAAVVHILWSILVALNWAQPFLTFVYGMHFLSIPFTVMPFSLGRAVILVIIAFIIAYIFGTIFGTIWNKVNK